MIRFYIKELISEKSFREGQVITISEVAQHTGIHRMTLSKMVNKKGSSVTTDNIDKLCKYFECEVSDVMRYVDSDD
ncbi:helix-turn-helix transcriptional regulator [Paraferrimonas sp. SM1919]|uniref:helix-turn-helix domain-containing protein n=1 Tax=Paraferrimonas sp. SM1919 TaxID=2662263 RepID=UPI0013D41DFF|nr:helix-turn-helix transcriptional regulator [Paraferrimonas sp. SM1919]